MDWLTKINDRRRELGMSQAELGRRAGVLEHMVCLYFQGKVRPVSDTLERLAEAVEMDLLPTRKIRAPRAKAPQ